VIFREPPLTQEDRDVLALIAKQRERLRVFTLNNPRRWLGSLRRSTFARAIQGSNSIEGYNASIDEAIAAVDDEPPMDERTETWFAIKGYRDAMTYILQASKDPFFELSKQFLKSLHFMMVGFDMTKYPGQWRPGGIFVVNAKSGQTVYEGPPAELIDDLVRELIDYLQADSRSPAIVKATMAHLNLTMIHPFKDGNGRMARAVQTLVLGREGILHPVFSSIEEWLGRNTEEYYRVLAEVGKGAWHPEHDAALWVRFCLKAHYQQAETLIRRNDEYDALFERIDAIIRRENLHERTAIPLFDAALGRRLTNSRYQAAAEVTQYIAGRDLKALAEIGLLAPIGERRGRAYFAGKELELAREAVRIRHSPANPYDVLRQAQSAARERTEPRLL
jgi:Fic family protein